MQHICLTKATQQFHALQAMDILAGHLEIGESSAKVRNGSVLHKVCVKMKSIRIEDRLWEFTHLGGSSFMLFPCLNISLYGSQSVLQVFLI